MGSNINSTQNSDFWNSQ